MPPKSFTAFRAWHCGLRGRLAARVLPREKESLLASRIASKFEVRRRQKKSSSLLFTSSLSRLHLPPESMGDTFDLFSSCRPQRYPYTIAKPFAAVIHANHAPPLIIGRRSLGTSACSHTTPTSLHREQKSSKYLPANRGYARLTLATSIQSQHLSQCVPATPPRSNSPNDSCYYCCVCYISPACDLRAWRRPD